MTGCDKETRTWKIPDVSGQASVQSHYGLKAEAVGVPTDATQGIDFPS